MSSSDAPSFKNKLTALVVDDVKLNRMFHRTLLKSLGLEIQEAENGKEAVDLFVAGATFNIVLMDLEMPVMNGIEATKNLRLMGVTDKIVAVSTNTGDRVKQDFLDAGADAYIVKPLTRAQLIPILEEIDNSL